MAGADEISGFRELARLEVGLETVRHPLGEGCDVLAVLLEVGTRRRLFGLLWILYPS